jgi:hypothetical protein
MKIPNIQSVDIEVRRGKVLSASIPLDIHIINTLTQVRQHMTHEETNDLAESILARGQQVPGRVAALKPRAAGQYLREINELFAVNHKLSSMKKVSIDGQEYYLFVIYGHRRLAACKHAWRMIQEEGYGSASFSGQYLCDIHFDLTLHDVIPTQLVENQYVPVSKYDEITALWRYWRYLKRHENDVTITSFAKRVGRRTSYVRDMLRFTSLPEVIQQRINPTNSKGYATYSLLLHVARLVEAHQKAECPLAEKEIILMVDLLTVRQVPTAVFAGEVTERIAQLNGEQADLFGGLSVSVRSVRKIAAEHILRAVMSQLHYLTSINKLMHDGSFGDISPYHVVGQPDKSAYSPHSPARMVLRMVDMLKGTIPDLAYIIERDGASRRRLDEALREIGMSYAVFQSIVAGE